METMIDLSCMYCGDTFERRLTEHKRSIRLGRGYYCNQSCCAKYHPNSQLKPHPENLVSNNRLDAYSSFRWFLKVVQQRYKKKGATNLDLVYLKTLWEKQNGICPLTGWKLLLPTTTSGWSRGRNLRNASLDRIDNSIGYMQGNVRYISVMANLARNTFTDEDLLEFCKAVVLQQAV